MPLYGRQWESSNESKVVRRPGWRSLAEDVYSCRANAAELCSWYVLFVKPLSFAARPRRILHPPRAPHEKSARWPISRVLSPFPGDGHSSRAPVAKRLNAAYPGGGPETRLPAEAGAPPLFGLAPGGVCRATAVAGGAVRSYRTLSPLPADLTRRAGGLLSVALSLGSPPPGVTRHRVSVEPGLSSPRAMRERRPSGRLAPP